MTVFFCFFLQKHLDFPTFLPQFYHRTLQTLQTSRTEGFDHDRCWIPLTQKQSSIHPSLWQFYANVCYFFFCESSESTELSRTFLPVKPLGWITSLHIWPFVRPSWIHGYVYINDKSFKTSFSFSPFATLFSLPPSSHFCAANHTTLGWNTNSIWGPLHPPWLLTNRCYNRGHIEPLSSSITLRWQHQHHQRDDEDTMSGARPLFSGRTLIQVSGSISLEWNWRADLIWGSFCLASERLQWIEPLHSLSFSDLYKHQHDPLTSECRPEERGQKLRDHTHTHKYLKANAPQTNNKNTKSKGEPYPAITAGLFIISPKKDNLQD